MFMVAERIIYTEEYILLNFTICLATNKAFMFSL